MVLASITVQETNGATGSEVTTLVVTSDYGATDAVNLTPADYPITAAAGAASFEKWQRCLCTVNDSTSVDNFKVFISLYSAVPDCTVVTNCATTAWTSTSYQTPAANTNRVTNPMPTSNPGAANVDIADSLTASIVNNGSYTDYVVHVLQVGASATEGPSTPWQYSWLYDETT